MSNLLSDAAADAKPNQPNSGMKGRISISGFIREVENELTVAQATAGRPYFEVAEVTLEVSFALDASAKAGSKLFVIELGGETKAQQTHKAVLKLKPLTAAQIAAIEVLRAARASGGSGTIVIADGGRSGNGGGGEGRELPRAATETAAVQPMPVPALWASPEGAALSAIAEECNRALAEVATSDVAVVAVEVGPMTERETEALAVDPERQRAMDEADVVPVQPTTTIQPAAGRQYG